MIDSTDQARSSICFFSYQNFQKLLQQIKTEENGLEQFTSAYTHYGIHADSRTNEIKIKEWAPNAKAMYIRGDFSAFSSVLAIGIAASLSIFQTIGKSVNIHSLEINGVFGVRQFHLWPTVHWRSSTVKQLK
jgi:hypothetical protein